MALSDDDLAAIGRLLDARLEAERRVRRRWTWFWLALLVGSTIASAVVLHQWVERAKDYLDEQHQAAEEAAAAYRAELARNQQWQADRAKAEKAVGYQFNMTQQAHEAALMQRAITLMGKQAELKKKWEGLDFNDPKSSEILAEDMGEVLEQGLGAVGAVLLRGTDPAHAPASDPRTRDGQGSAAPVLHREPATPAPP